MKRKLMDQLIKWKDVSPKKPVLITGGRGTGKTYLAFDFAKEFYQQSVYLNYEREPYLFHELLDTVKQTEEFETYFNNRFSLKEDKGPTLLILDEVWKCQELLSLVNLCNKVKFRVDIIILSSYQFNQYAKEQLFTCLELYPLDFEEFLRASGNEWYIGVIKEHSHSNKKIPDIVHKELLALFDIYLNVGGMPLAVNEYNNTESIINVPEQHNILLNSYLAEVYKNVPEGEFLKISQVLGTMDKQLRKENKKFQYTLIRKGATQHLYAEALHYLENSYYGLNCFKIENFSQYITNTANGIGEYTVLNNVIDDTGSDSNKNDISTKAFKLYMPDIGMLHTKFKANIYQTVIPERRALIENYVAQTLKSQGYQLYFWESGSLAKIDFIIRNNKGFLPVEVRIDTNTRSKSLSILKQTTADFEYAIKISSKNFGFSGNIKYVPLYAVFCI